MPEERRQTGIYASCSYYETSLQKLKKWMLDHSEFIPTPIPLDQIHTTIVYSRKDFECPILGESVKLKDAQQLWPSGFALLGDAKDEKSCLVLTLDAPSLVNVHNYLIDQGAEHDYDDYIPHVTLSYDVPKDFDVSALTLPDFYIVPKEIKFEPLNLNWSLQSDENVI